MNKAKKSSVSTATILKLSLPIMIGSAVQNVITLTDTIFLGRVGKVELGAIGLVGVFYLLIASVGYSFSKAGQIMVARRVGERKLEEIGSITYSMWVFALGLATVLFFFMQFGSRSFFGLFLNGADDQAIFQACVDYLDYRSFGIFFSYSAVIIMALYTGVARTSIIIGNALVLGIANTFLNYSLINGVWGFPKMGMAGAGLASTIAEVISFLIFVVYIFIDKANRAYNLFKWPKINLEIIRQQLKISTPIVLQSAVGMGSWFIFFILIGRRGEDELAIANVIRSLYLLLMIPAWGFSSGMNTIASNLIGQKKDAELFSTTHKTAIICTLFSALCCAITMIWPETLLSISTNDTEIIQGAVEILWALMISVLIFAFGTIYFNSVIGIGATKQALWIQMSTVFVYMFYIIIGIEYLDIPLDHAFMSEVYYWGIITVLSIYYLRSNKWLNIKV